MRQIRVVTNVNQLLLRHKQTDNT